MGIRMRVLHGVSFFYNFSPVQPFLTNKDVIKRCLCVHFRSGVPYRALFSLFDGGDLR